MSGQMMTGCYSCLLYTSHSSIARELEDSRKDEEELEVFIETKQKELEEWKAEETEKNHVLEKIRLEESSLEQQNHFLQENISRLKNEIEAFHRESEEITENLSRSAEEIHKKEDGIEELKKAVTECAGKEKVLDARRIEWQEEKEKRSNSHKSFFEKRDHLSEKTTLLDKEDVYKRQGEGGEPLLEVCKENGVNTEFIRQIPGPVSYTHLKKRMLVIAAAVATSMMMASPVMADDFKVGICNYVDDASLNQIVDNIQSRLEEIGEEKGITFDVSYDNCNADASVMEQIISDFQADNVDPVSYTHLDVYKRQIQAATNFWMQKHSRKFSSGNTIRQYLQSMVMWILCHWHSV